MLLLYMLQELTLTIALCISKLDNYKALCDLKLLDVWTAHTSAE